ncbi:MAG TPA: DUF1508 domain-containing protein [Pyrinomonadaceae bacterium]|nr:DUF1508 domain-containing protein [Pyrinomonadaceae bacterium]
MDAEHALLKDELENYEAQLRGLTSYVRELNQKVAEHGTDRAHVADDLAEAEHNIKYYEAEAERLKGIIGKGSSDATYEVYEDSAGEWRWRLRAGNNRIIADSGEGYRDRRDCLHGIDLVKNSKHAPVEEGR